jgi:hypothetical protein
MIVFHIRSAHFQQIIEACGIRGCGPLLQRVGEGRELTELVPPEAWMKMASEWSSGFGLSWAAKPISNPSPSIAGFARGRPTATCHRARHISLSMTGHPVPRASIPARRSAWVQACVDAADAIPQFEGCDVSHELSGARQDVVMSFVNLRELSAFAGLRAVPVAACPCGS